MLAITTAEKVEAVLTEHRAQENPPTFICECLNGRQQRELLFIKDGLDNGKDTDNFDKVFTAVDAHLIGWRNVGIPYKKGALLDLINYSQALELLGHLVFQSPTVEDKKKSKLQSQSNTANSARRVKARKTVKKDSTRMPPAGT